ncbi:MAG: hypothetical protein J7502_18005, partial [Flavisolibacter sp.]|nr:hypothetical protein [Flavisolibacter sp.]
MEDGLVSDLETANSNIALPRFNQKNSGVMVKKVVFIMSLPLSTKIISDFYIREILDEGIEVEYWNVAEILFKKTYPTPEGNLKGVGSCTFRFLSDFKKAIFKSDKLTTVFIPQITYDYRSFKIFRIISKANCCTFFFARGALPINPGKKRSDFLKLLNYRLPFKLASKISQKIIAFYLLESKKRGWIKPHDVLFAAGSKAPQVIGVGGKLDFGKGKVVPINYFDYDVFQSEAAKESVPSQNYCVFLDEYLTRHPDFIALGIPLVDEQSYFNHLNNFFASVEKALNIKVVIAAP